MDQSSQNNGSFDVGQQYLATVYAKALLGATEKNGTTQDALDEFDSLVTDVLDKLRSFETVLMSPRVAHEEKVVLLERAFRGRMSPLMLNFLKVVSSHGRMDVLRQINRAVHQQYNEMRNRVEVNLQSAALLKPDMLEQIRSRLQLTLGRDVDLKTRVNPDVIGGLVLRIGDTVYDGSVANRLRRLRDETMEKTAQEIRHSLDRFAVSELSSY